MSIDTTILIIDIIGSGVLGALISEEATKDFKHAAAIGSVLPVLTFSLWCMVKITTDISSIPNLIGEQLETAILAIIPSTPTAYFSGLISEIIKR